MRPTRHQALVIAGHAGAADIRAQFIDAASGRLADFACKSRAARAVTAHAGQVGRYIFFRDPVELRVILGGEARPLGRIGTACAAALAVEGGRQQAAWRKNGKVAISVLRQGATSS